MSQPGVHQIFFIVREKYSWPAAYETDSNILYIYWN